METWKDIPDRSGYQVSDHGRIRSFVRFSDGRVLRPCTNLRGYRQVILGTTGGIHTVHSLVLRAFVGERPDGMEINHKNGVKTDNRIENLEYVTKQQNEDHSRHTLGNYFRGERHGMSKLNEEQVREIRALRKAGLTLWAIANKYGITAANVDYIAKGQAWKHVS